MSGLMTPESLSREGSPGPDGGSITLHPAPQQSNNGIIMSNDSPAQVVASHLEVKTNNFTPGVHHHPTGHLLTTGTTPPSKIFFKFFTGNRFHEKNFFHEIKIASNKVSTNFLQW